MALTEKELGQILQNPKTNPKVKRQLREAGVTDEDYFGIVGGENTDEKQKRLLKEKEILDQIYQQHPLKFWLTIKLGNWLTREIEKKSDPENIL